MEKESSNEMSKKTSRSLEEARTSYLEMMEEIAPFLKPRTRKRYSTAGEWRAFRYEGAASVPGNRGGSEQEETA